MAKKKPKIIGYIDASGNFNEGTTMPSIEKQNKSIKSTPISSNKNVDIKSLQNSMTIKPNKTNNQNNNTDIRTIKTEQPKKTTVSTVNNDGYTETNKKYGDYKYQDYANKKDYKIYTKDNKSYYYDEKNNRYVDMDEQSMTTKELDKKEYKNAVKQGYKGSRTYNSKDVQVEPSKVADKVALESSGLTKKEKEKYKKSLIKQEKQKGKELNFVKKSGTGFDAMAGAWNNQIVNPNGPLQKNVIQPVSNAGRIYESGKINNELALEWYKKMQGKPNKADELQAKADVFNRFNQDVASGDIGAVGQTIQNLNTQVESFKNQGIAASAGGLIGGAGGALVGIKTGNPVGGAIKGAKLGSKVGYTVGSTPYMYKLEAGNQYKDLIEMGVSQKKAKKVAKAVGSINAAIESGENIVDLFSFEGAGKIASNEVKSKALKKMRNEVGEVIEELGEKDAKSYLSRLYGSEFAENIIKTYGKNVLSEGTEEATQEAVGIIGERYATGSEGIDRGVSLQQDLQRVGQSGLAGGGSALLMGIPTTFAGNTASYGMGKANNYLANRGNTNGNNLNTINNNVPSTQQVREVNEIQQRAQNGEISYEQANQQLAQVQEGTYQQNQLIEGMAKQEVEKIQREVETGQMSPVEASQEIQAVNNTLTSEREKINQPVQEVKEANIEETTQEKPVEKSSNEQETTQEPIKVETRETKSSENKAEKVTTEVIKSTHNNENGRSYKGAFYKDNAYGKLSDKEIKTAGDLREKIKNKQKLTTKENQTLEVLNRKRQGLKNPELKTNNTFEEVKRDLARTKLDNYDDKLMREAKEINKANKQGRRTKQQWLDTAKFMGMQMQDADSKAIKDYALQTFISERPNTKDNLNRQGKKFVDFKANEWVNAFYEGARVGEKIETKEETPKTQEIEKTTQETKGEQNIQEPTNVEETKETIEEKPKQEIVKSDGNVMTAPIDTKGKNKLANIEINVNNDGGNNNNNNGSNLTKQGDNNNRGDEAQILENYKDRKANKKQPFKERAAELMHSAVKGVFDSAEEIVRIGKYHNDAQLNPLYDMTLTANSTADFNIGGMKDSYQSNLSGEKIGESLENCWKPVEDAGLVRQMNAYLYEQHNIDRWNQFNDDGSRKYVFGPEHSDLVSKRNIAEMLEVHPELEELSKPILNYQKNLLKVLVEGGQVSQSHADHLNEIYKNYVPTWRDKDVQSNKTLKNSKGKIDINNPLKEATGSSEDLLPLKEVQAQMTKNVFKTSRTNLFGQQLYKDIGDLDKLKQIGMGELNKQYAENGKVDVVNQEQFLKEGEKYLDEYLKEFAPNNVPVDIKNGQKTMNVYFNGVKVAMPIDEGIETALKPLKPQNDLAKVLSKVNNFKRGVITQYNPGFSISNALKDAPDAMLNSKYGKEFPAEYAKTMKEMLDRGLSKGDQELFNQYCALGGLSNRTFDTFEGFKKDSTAKKVVGFVPSKISDVNDIIEQIPRFTEFKLSLKNGTTLSEAMYNAADLTTNFKRGGTLTKALDAYGTTFLSASTGGFYKQIRNITQQPSGKAFLKFAAKGMALGLTPAIINSLLYSSPFGDDDDKEEAKNAYDKLRQYEKDDYLLWYQGDGKFIKIPKGRAVSIPAIMYNAVLNTTKGEKVNIKDVFTSVLNQIGPNNPLSDNAILSLSQIDLLNKKSQGKSWSGSPIESSYMQSLEPGLRYDSKTDEFSKWLGGKLNVSPKKINYVIQQNTGILGDLLLPAITPKTTGPNALARGTNFLTRRFTTDTVGSNTTTEKFYDKQTELTEKQNNPKKASDENAIRKNYMSLRAGEIAEKRKEIEEINSDKSLTKDEKYKKIRALQKDINNISEDTLKKVEKVKKQGDYAATIGGNVYTKNDYGQWKKESEQAKAKRDSLGLSVEDYYYLKKEEAYTQPNGRKQSLVDGETAKQKIALVDAFGFDPSDYLEYSYNINNIKEGKNTKQKVFEYINSLDISQEQKIALMKKKYKTYRSYDNQLYNTINNADLTKEEKESVANFLKIGG